MSNPNYQRNAINVVVRRADRHNLSRHQKLLGNKTSPVVITINGEPLTYLGISRPANRLGTEGESGVIVVAKDGQQPTESLQPLIKLDLTSVLHVVLLHPAKLRKGSPIQTVELLSPGKATQHADRLEIPVRRTRIRNWYAVVV